MRHAVARLFVALSNDVSNDDVKSKFLTTKDTKVTKDFRDKRFLCLAVALSTNSLCLTILLLPLIHLLFLRVLCG
jgi:hypothetical protein